MFEEAQPEVGHSLEGVLQLNGQRFIVAPYDESLSGLELLIYSDLLLAVSSTIVDIAERKGMPVANVAKGLARLLDKGYVRCEDGIYFPVVPVKAQLGGREDEQKVGFPLLRDGLEKSLQDHLHSYIKERIELAPPSERRDVVFQELNNLGTFLYGAIDADRLLNYVKPLGGVWAVCRALLQALGYTNDPFEVLDKMVKEKNARQEEDA